MTPHDSNTEWTVLWQSGSPADPVAEWRARWQSDPRSFTGRLPGVPRSPWTYAVAAFGGTVVALTFCLGLFVVASVAVTMRKNGWDTTPQSLTYRNDTEGEVWIYECYDRCEELRWGFPMTPGEELSMRLAWYYEDEVEWVIVSHEDLTYGCLRLTRWVDQTIDVSSAVPCPPDIHSPDVVQF